VRGAGAGLAASALAGLLGGCRADGRHRAADGRPAVLVQNWIVNLHPAVLAAAGPRRRIDLRVAPAEGIDVARFLREAERRTSTWDAFVGITPFDDLARLVEGGAIDPWDPYIPEEVLTTSYRLSAPRARSAARSTAGRSFSTSSCRAGTPSSSSAPSSIRTGRRRPGTSTFGTRGQSSSEERPFGCTFDPRGWRSLIPIAYTFSPEIYRDDGALDLTHEAVVQALEVLRRMKELAPDDVLDPRTSVGAGLGPDERRSRPESSPTG
jgi:multiple sugar transport system substrate-binding protein